MDLWVNVERPTSPATTNYVQGGPKGTYNEDLAETCQNLELRAGQSQLERKGGRKAESCLCFPSGVGFSIFVKPYLKPFNLLAISDRI